MGSKIDWLSEKGSDGSASHVFSPEGPRCRSAIEENTIADSKKKGDLLEDLVALIHEAQGVKIEKRVKFPTKDGKSSREIDVLLTVGVLGYPVRMAFECKNEREKVGVEKIDGFVGKLKDVGIPCVHGIYVSPTGYTSEAMRRAEARGIRLLLFEGLSPDRLEAAVNQAMTSITYVVLEVGNFNVFPFLPDSAEGHVWSDKEPADSTALLNWVFNKWIEGEIPEVLGEHQLVIRTGAGGVAIMVNIVYYVGQLSGTAKRFTLTNAIDATVEKTRVELTSMRQKIFM